MSKKDALSLIIADVCSNHLIPNPTKNYYGPHSRSVHCAGERELRDAIIEISRLWEKIIEE